MVMNSLLAISLMATTFGIASGAYGDLLLSLQSTGEEEIFILAILQYSIENIAILFHLGF